MGRSSTAFKLPSSKFASSEPAFDVQFALAALIEAPLMMRTFQKYTAEDLERSALHHLEIVRALEARAMAGQAIPSHAPMQSGRYFQKLECFCFARQELKAGEEWQFMKSFDGADMTYTCSFGEAKGDVLPIKIAIKQDYTVLENDSMEVVPKEDAVREVTTQMTGTGEANFDTKRGIFTSVKMKNVAKSQATDFDSKKKTDRVLRQELTLKLKEEPKVAKSQPQKPVTLKEHASAMWDNTVQFSQNLWDKTKGFASLAKLLIQSQMKMIPGLGGMLGR